MGCAYPHKSSTPPWSFLGWVRLPMSRPSNWWASSSSLRTRFSPPPPSPPRSFSLLPPPQSTAKGDRPHPDFSSPSHAPLSSPARSQPGLTSRRSRRRPPRPRPRYAPHAPLPTPRFLRLSPAQSSPIRAVSVAGRSGVRVRRDRARRGDPEFPTGVVGLIGPGRWIRSGSRRG